MRTGVNLYPPSAPVVVVSSAPVPSLDKVTLAALMAPPEASETTPEIEPVSTCAYDGNAVHRVTNRTDATARTSRPPQKRTDLRCITILLKNLPVLSSAPLLSLLLANLAHGSKRLLRVTCCQQSYSLTEKETASEHGPQIFLDESATFGM